MTAKYLLAAWSFVGMLWWVISWWLVVAAARPARGIPGPREKKSLTIFKPLPCLEGRGLEVEARGLESFIKQMNDETELLLGVHEIDWPEVAPFVQRMQAAYPKARVVVVRRSEGDTLANPKIAWQKLLVPHATGEHWLWSDADIVAPPGFLERARAEFEACGADLLTFPYAMRTINRSRAILDALFVNAEFYPGVLLLRRLGPVDFGLGAALLFSRDSFLRKVDWEKLGSALADDFMLGQILQPVRIGSTTLETVADAGAGHSAWSHYYRWKKTIYWCRPVGFAFQVLTMPLLGWMALVAFHPISLWAWAGFLGMMQVDVLFAILICRKIGCPLSLHSWPVLEAWSVSRILFWAACWLPGRVKWREKCWNGFEKSTPDAALSKLPKIH